MVINQSTVNKAYDQLSDTYHYISSLRSNYIQSVNNLMVETVDGPYLLDIGSGDGLRLAIFNGHPTVRQITCLEPSGAMFLKLKHNTSVTALNLAAQQFYAPLVNSFDTVTLMWNVLGHIPSQHEVNLSLRNIFSYLRTGGKLILDCHNRYNASQYGYLTVLLRILVDALWFKRERGDVYSTLDAMNNSISTYGHLFTPREVAEALHESGFAIRRHQFIHYDTGNVSNLFVRGHHFLVAEKPF